jgi:ketosteroid isomerase-like protein
MSDSDRIAVLEKRLAILEDKEKIREVLARYGYNADLGRSDEYVNVWTKDGVYDLDAGKLEGEAAIREMISSPTGAHKSQIENRSMHTVCNLHIGIEGDTAWAEGYSVVWVKGEDGKAAPWTVGYNHWEFRRSGDGWLMTLRRRRDVGGPVWGGDVIKSYLTADDLPTV